MALNRPVTAVPAATRSSERVRKLIVNTILIVGAVSALCGVFATIAWIAFSPNVPTKDDIIPVASATAYTVATDFLAGRPTAVPVADGVDRTFGRINVRVDERPEPLPVVSLSVLEVVDGFLSGGDQGGPAQQYEIHRFLVGVSPEVGEADEFIPVGSLYTLEVTMLVTRQGPVLGATPALLPYLGADDGVFRPIDYSQFTGPSGTSVPEASRAAIQSWAEAYTSNNAAALRQITQDGIHEEDYVGLSGFTLAEDVQIVSAVPVGDGTTLQVQVLLLVSSDRANGFESTLSYDLRVERTNTQSPAVTAWGPPGSTGLQPYQNNPGFGN